MLCVTQQKGDLVLPLPNASLKHASMEALFLVETNADANVSLHGQEKIVKFAIVHVSMEES